MSKLYQYFSNYSDRLIHVLKEVKQDNLNLLQGEIQKRISNSKSIHILGNGGSAANASHIVGDYTKSFMMLNRKLSIHSWSDSACYTTATANDIDFTEIYSSLVNTFILPGDLIIYLSGSGNSLNLVKCARKAYDLDIFQSAILGYNGGALKELVDLSIHLDINDMEIAEDMQLIIFHYLKQNLTELIKSEFKNQDNVSNKYNKRVNENIIA